MTSQIHEECGVMGVFGVPGAAGIVRTGLTFLQHRGQEGCGIAYADKSGEITLEKGLGLVSALFPEGKASAWKSLNAIGHVRYGTFGGHGVENVQPFVFRRQSGAYATAHNGNIVNARELTAALSARGVLFSSSTDSELFGALIGESLKMGADVNAQLLAMEFNGMLPPDEIPARTEGHEGFYHLTDSSGNTSEASLTYILRDHDAEKFDARKKKILGIAEKLNAKYGPGTVSCSIRDQYRNMAEVIAKYPEVVRIAEAAIRDVGLEPEFPPVRGGGKLHYYRYYRSGTPPGGGRDGPVHRAHAAA